MYTNICDECCLIDILFLRESFKINASNEGSYKDKKKNWCFHSAELKDLKRTLMVSVFSCRLLYVVTEKVKDKHNC